MAKISVIVPIYGVEKYLRKAVDSLIRQTLTDIEIILINDGSKDNCPKIIDEYAKLDNRVVAIHKENSGYGATMNVGLERATGEYIAVLEPDDYIEPNMYEDLYKIAKEYNSDIVKSSFYDNLQGKFEKWVEKANWDYDKIPQDKSFTIYECPLFLYYHPSIWSCIYKREFIEKNNIRFVEAPGAGWSDNPFQVQTMCLAERINFTPNAYYYWLRINEDESDDLKDPTVPFKRSKEIHDWLDENNINNEEILFNLYKRELAYAKIISGKKGINFSKYTDDLKELLSRFPEKKFLNSPFARNSEKKQVKTFKNNPKLYRFKLLFKKYRKNIFSLRLRKTEKRLVMFGRVYHFSSKNIKKTLNLCFSSNENYAQHLCCALKSIFLNKKRDENFNIIILNEDITQKTQAYISSMLPKGSTIRFVNVDESAFKYCPLTEDAFHIKSLTTYYRFILPSVCDFDKVLYLDCDIIVKKSLSELFETNVEDYYLAGVQDSYVDENCKRLGLNKYVNAGIILLNLKKWREDNIQEKLFAWAKENQEKILWVDQDVINTVLNEKILYLKDEFNAQISDLEFGKVKEFNKIAHMATIVHYVGHRKPWTHYDFKLNKYYYKYLNLLKGAWNWKFRHYILYFKHFRKQAIRLKISKECTYIILFGKTLYSNRVEGE